jgi:general secretion pathway protein G
MLSARTAIVSGCVAIVAAAALLVAMDGPGCADDPLDFLEHHLNRLWTKIVPGPPGCYPDNARTHGYLQGFATQLQLYRSINGRFPSTEEGLSALVAKPVGADLPNWKPLMPELPADPWGRPYQYRCPAIISREPFEVFSLGPDGLVSDDDIGTW